MKNLNDEEGILTLEITFEFNLIKDLIQKEQSNA